MKRAHLPAAALCAASLTAAAAAASPSVPRYRCALPDGSTRVVVQNLSQAFAGAVGPCTPMQMREATPEATPQPAQAPAYVDLTWTPMPDDAPAPPSPLNLSASMRTLVHETGERYRLDTSLLASLIHVESRYQAQARSPKGALGLMQIMPATGARYGVRTPHLLLDPATNLDVGARYLRDLHHMFDGRIELVLAAYNAGEGAVMRYGNRIPPYRETQEYVRKIMALYRGGAVR